jgi:hypothetical protein
MAAANGTLTPPSLPPAPSSPSLSPAKRKRAHTQTAVTSNGASPGTHGKSASQGPRSLQAAIEDIVTVLKK